MELVNEEGSVLPNADSMDPDAEEREEEEEELSPTPQKQPRIPIIPRLTLERIYDESPAKKFERPTSSKVKNNNR